MSTTIDSAKTEASLSFLMGSFARVLRRTGAARVADRLPWRETWSEDPSPDEPLGEAPTNIDFPEEISQACLQAYSIAFQLLNQAEENTIAQRRRATEAAGQLDSESGSWDQNLAAALAAGHDVEALVEALAQLRVEPVFTAHPTEAKRQTVLEHHRALYRLLVELENTMWTAAERAAI
jgi:phosphoenolpyruvate carboxylase